jgi:hypothetical protein
VPPATRGVRTALKCGISVLQQPRQDFVVTAIFEELRVRVAPASREVIRAKLVYFP